MTWSEEPHQAITTTSSYTEYTVELPEGCKYIKLDADGSQQIRVDYMIITFA